MSSGVTPYQLSYLITCEELDVHPAAVHRLPAQARADFEAKRQGHFSRIDRAEVAPADTLNAAKRRQRDALRQRPAKVKPASTPSGRDDSRPSGGPWPAVKS
jgi:hypothetical protein